jgi:phosphatidylserine/phosphatidylglycerophosphate/cardiolipin synthase-like enzyme/uncharacterized membrane protein YdjX (TVP38/TMEM64 family)
VELLIPGTTCWRTPHAQRVAMLVDAAAYFGALREAIGAAQRSLFIIGWDVDSRTPLAADPSAPQQDGLPLRLLDFLNAVLARTPGLQAHVLSWDFSMIYALEREMLSSLKFGWRAHPRLHFALDDQHPPGASQHQKLVVIDDRVAFCGGIDLTIRRWDTPAHGADDPRRRDPRGTAYAPMHDVQLAVDGEAATMLGDLARERWRAATAERLAPVAAMRAPHFWQRTRGAPLADPWPPKLQPDFRDLHVGIARTQYAIDPAAPRVREVLALNLAAIAAARDTILIENQFLTSAAIGDALARRLTERDGPDVIAVLPRVECGWMERSSMGILRARMLTRLQRANRHGHLHVYYPSLPGLGAQSVNVHSKLLAIDDRLLKIGSSNLSNRSMGLDSECDIAIEAGGDVGTDPVARGIAGVRWRLLAEHLGAQPDEVEAGARELGSIAALIDSRRGRARCLEPLVDEPSTALNLALLDGTVVDPERPMDADAFMLQLVPQELQRPARRSLYGVLAVLGLVLLAISAWHFTPLHALASAERVAALVRELRASPFGAIYVLAAYVLGASLFFPITVLIAGTALAFDPLRASVFSMAGALLSAALSYGCGRMLGRAPLRRLGGIRFETLSAPIRRRGFRTIVSARLLPLGNFTAINLIAGALRVPFRAYLLGNVVGLLPGVLGLSLLAGGLQRALRRPTVANLALLALCVIALGYGVLRLKRALDEKSRSAPRRVPLSEQRGAAE